MQPLKVRRSVELLPQGPLAQVVPLGEEPGPLVEASDLLPAELVHHGLEGRVRRQDREPGEPLVLRGSAGHLVGQAQELPRVRHRATEGTWRRPALSRAGRVGANWSHVEDALITPRTYRQPPTASLGYMNLHASRRNWPGACR
jgi:hypothetical protein